MKPAFPPSWTATVAPLPARRLACAVAALVLAGCAASPPPFYAATVSPSIVNVYGAEASAEAAPDPGPADSAASANALAATDRSNPSQAFAPYPLPGTGGAVLQALLRSERTPPLRYRVIVIPGSGCAGMGSIAERYFAGLLHAQVLVLHKPGVDPAARTAPGECGSDFVQQDRLGAWLSHARAALQADALQRARDGSPALPQLLVGISEGGELLAALAPEVPDLAGLVLLSSSGLDPQEAGTLQAQRLEMQADWRALRREVAGPRPDTAVVQGRSLGYWRDLWRWPLTLPLVQSPWPLVQVWGEDDALVPPAAYEQFGQLASLRTVPFCARSLPGADHGLQRRAEGAGAVDGVQQVWSWTEQWARDPAAGLCAPLWR